MTDMGSAGFYRAVRAFERFDDVVDMARYAPIPGDWIVGVADVVDSTAAIAAGRYKAVNLVGASVIAAVLNARGGRPFPYAFGGDGASFAVPAVDGAVVSGAMAAVRRWAEDEIGLALRAALVPVTDIRRAGREVAIARFRVSDHCDYAMFAGGGIAWAEARMKAGLYAVDAAERGARPDLSGLSCRWMPLAAQRGEIVSLLVAPADDGDPMRFADLVRRILDIVAAEDARHGHPVPDEGPRFAWPPRGLDLEARAARATRPLWLRRTAILVNALIPWLLQSAGRRLRRFDPALYRLDTAHNTDFRKFEDGLKLTVDCSADVVSRLEELLNAAEAAGIVDYGLHRQDRALMTCIVPSPFARDHMHFVDGAAGGYARAAERLKRMKARRSTEKSAIGQCPAQTG